MKEIRNKTGRPLRVPLPGGKTLFLGPNQVAQVADKAIEHAGILGLVEKEQVEILGDGTQNKGANRKGAGKEHTQGSTKSFRRGSGDR